MSERKWFTRLVWVVILVISLSLILVKSVATAESNLQTDDPDSADRAATPMGINPNEEAFSQEMSSPLTREALSLEASNYFVIPPSGFVDDGTDPTGYTIDFGYGYLVGGQVTASCMAAAVNLPLGASIDGMEVRLNDQEEIQKEMFALTRINLETGAVEAIASVYSPDGITSGIVSIVSDSVTSPIVSEEYAYQIVTCLRQDIYIYGVRIGYSFTTYLPTVSD